MNEYITPSRYKAILKLYLEILNENKDLKEELKELKKRMKYEGVMENYHNAVSRLGDL